MAAIAITPSVRVDESEFQERFVRASGPGGQNVNKVATAVELDFDVWGSSLPQAVKQRLVSLAGRRVSAEGVLRIDSREYRTQAQNRDAARARLADLVRRALVVPKKRTATRPGKAAKERRLSTKKRRSMVKAGRGSPGAED